MRGRGRKLPVTGIEAVFALKPSTVPGKIGSAGLSAEPGRLRCGELERCVVRPAKTGDRGEAALGKRGAPEAVRLGMQPAASMAEAERRPSSKASPLGERCNVRRAVQDADDDNCIRNHSVVDGVWRVELDAQPRTQRLARRSGERKMPQRFQCRLDRGDEAGGDRLGGLGSEGGPDFGQIMLGCIRQTERERPANSFFPRSIIRAASNSSTRPSATSDRPRSISALSAASSCN